jgi:hypothetical protein
MTNNKKSRVHVEVPQSLKRQVVSHLALEGRTLTDLITKAMQDYLRTSSTRSAKSEQEKEA